MLRGVGGSPLHRAAYALIVLALALASTDAIAQGGRGEEETVGCQASPAACLGAGTPLPLPGVDGSTSPFPGCRVGRILDAETGQSDAVPFCPDVDGDGVADAPAPPTAAEVVAICPPLPAPQIGHNPHQYGITGMETWLWDASAPIAQTTTGTIRSYAVSCTLTPTTWTFDTGDPHAARYGHARTYTSTSPGTEAETTEVRHLWEVTGTYTLTLTTTWERTTAVGGTPTSRTALTRTATTDLPVRQVRPVPTTGPARQ